MSEEKLKRMKSLIRAVLMSSKEGVAAARLLGDYSEFAGEYLPFKEMGFPNVTKFIESIPDVARVRTDMTGEQRFYAVADESTEHIQKMVSKQKTASKKRKKLPRGPHRRPVHPVGPGRPSGPSRPSRRPRYPGAGYGRPAYRPPLLPTPHSNRFRDPASVNINNSSYSNFRPGFGSKPNDDAFKNYKITVGNRGGDRAVNSSQKMFFQAVGDASDARRKNPSAVHTDVKFGHNYEVPPRFQKKESRSKPVAVSPSTVELWDSPESTAQDATHNKVIKWSDEHVFEYLELLEEYSHTHDVEVKFTTKLVVIGGVKGYLGLIHIHDKAVGSIEVFETELLAKEEAAKNVCKQFDITESNLYQKKPGLSLPSAETSITVPGNIKDNIKKLLSTVTVSMWCTRFPVVYAEKFGEAPNNIIEMVRSCPDIARFEKVPNTDREMIYPVKHTEDTPPEPTPVPKPLPVPNPSPVISSTPIQPIPSTPAVDVFKDVVIPPSESINIGCEETVFVTYATSCYEFYVQLESSCSDDINDVLQTECKSLAKPNASSIKKGIYCSALYSSDKQWYRAQVISDINNQEFHVRFVDYGNVECVSIDCIRQLPQKVINTPQQAIYCSLYGIQPIVGEEWSKASLGILAEFVRDQELIAVPFTHSADGYQEIELYQRHDREKSLNQILVEKNEAVCILSPQVTQPDFERRPDEPELLEIPDDKFMDVYVSFFNPATGIMVRIVGEQFSDKLEELEAQLEAFYKLAPYDQTIEVGMVCVISLDTLYHRVKVLSIDGNKAECYFLDHGDTENILTEGLKPIDAEINKTLPYQAFSFELYGLENVMGDATLLEKLYELALAKILVAEIISRDEKISVVLYDTQEQDDININEYIAKVLISEGHAIDLNLFTANIGPNTPSDSLSIASNEGTESPTSSIPKTEIPQNVVAPFENKTVPDESLIANLNCLSLSQNAADISQSSVITASAKSTSSLYTWEKPATSTSTNDVVVQPPGLSLSNEQQADLKMPENVTIPAIGEMFAIYILWIVDPSNFVCIPHDKLEDLERFMVEFNNYFSKAAVLEEVEPVVGEVYAGRYNGNWYRMIVKNIIGSELSVYMADYGEYAILTADDLEPLPKKYYTLPFVAFKAKLYDVSWCSEKGLTFQGEKWTESAKYTFMQMAQGRSLFAYICGKDEDGVVSLRLVDTSDENEDVCIDDVLVSMSLARRQ
ncbi:tudor domain-containing protein 7 isoform X2 [Patella vulgata]|uniref:tudor domain-containing protein 7 isoform X2 n=1 Tax=Patella vulgata TaxID=6465 RepID=UPI0024A8F772|nr:tudor domain-containing protein 7 isoform X2 [Patella vulgata]